MRGPYMALGKNAAADKTFAKIGWPMFSKKIIARGNKC